MLVRAGWKELDGHMTKDFKIMIADNIYLDCSVFSVSTAKLLMSVWYGGKTRHKFWFSTSVVLSPMNLIAEHRLCEKNGML